MRGRGTDSLRTADAFPVARNVSAVRRLGYGVRSPKNSFNGTFQQKPLPDPSGIPDSGTRYEWFILTTLANIPRFITLWKCKVTAMRFSVRRLTFK